MKPTLISVFCAAAAACVWLAVPRASTPSAFAGEVTSAIGRANTWHFVGWRMDNGKKIPWEVWGRRQPFFYREQIGDDILIDNGQTRLRLLPPDTTLQKRGYAVSLPSDRLTLQKVESDEYGPRQRFLEGISGDYLSHMGEKASGETQVTYEGIQESGSTKYESQLDVDIKSHLPTHYRETWFERRSSDAIPHPLFGPPVSAADLTMNYDVAISRDAMTASIPSDYQRFDGSNGLELRPEFIGRDAQGTIHIKVVCWFADKPFGYDDPYPWFHANVAFQCPPYTQPRDARYPTDDLGQSYEPTIKSHADSEDIYMKPAKNAVLTPRLVKIPVVAYLSFTKLTPDEQGEKQVSFLPLFDKEMTLTVPLQSATQQTPLDSK